MSVHCCPFTLMERQDLLRLLRLFVDILLLRAGPQDVPASPTLLALAVLASLAASTLLALEGGFNAAAAPVRVGLELAVMALLLLGMLVVYAVRSRFCQTFTALCGTLAILTVLAWPLFGVIQGQEDGDGLVALALFLLWGLFGWSIVVIGHMLRHALEIGLVRALLFALAYTLLVAAVGEALMPRPEAA